MPREATEDELQRWKHKYYDSLADNERQQQALTSLEALLYRSLGRLALVGYGGSADLDKVLDKLRDGLRTKCSHRDIEALVERATTVAERANGAARAAAPAQPPADAHKPLLDILDQLGDYPGARALRKRIDKSADAAEAARTIGSWLSEQFIEREQAPARPTDESAGCVTVLNHLADAVSAPPACRQTLQRLLDGQNDPLPRRLAFELVDKAAAALNAELARTSMVPTDLLHAALIELIRGLLSLFDDNTELRSLEQSLREQTDFEHHVSTLGRIANVVASLQERVHAERVGIESFLGLVTDRLHELEAFVDGAHADHHASEAAGRELGEEVDREVRDLQDAAHRATDIGSLRSSLDTRLEHISSRLVRHLEQERQRSERARTELSRLDVKLRETEAEAGRLQRILDDERAKAAQDSLTGIWNRGAFDKRLEEEVSRARRSGRPLSLMFLDVDHFKRLNDTYGHQAGDRVLASVAQLVGKGLRAHDFPARYGGEEFVVLMPDTSAEQAMVVAERVREAVAQAGFRFKGQPVRVTLSAGVSSLGCEDGSEELVANADRALYEAKNAGRNRCVSAAA